MHPWHDVRKERITDSDFVAYIEVSKGNKTKYELDKESGLLILDRVLFTSTSYPQNYGFIPKTLARDGDPLDVLVLCSEALIPGSFIQCKPVGVLTMIDNGKPDEKIIAVPFKDPFYSEFNDLNQLPNHVMDEIKHFFKVYKELENLPTQVEDFEDVNSAKSAIVDSLKRYSEKFE